MRRILAVVVAALGLSLATAAPAPAVVNGSDAVSNPGAVSLWTQSPYRNRCTGALIDDGGAAGTKWVATAAHCVYVLSDPAAGGTEARIGALDNTTGGDFETIPVVSYTWHPGFDPETLANDFMLVQLKWPTHQPAMVWNLSALPVGGVGEVNGFGWVCDGPSGQTCSSWYQGPLQRYTAKVLPDSDCVTVVDVNQVCSESSTGAYQSACLGDSGAPMSTKHFNGYKWVHAFRVMVLGDGDDWSGRSCITTPDGDNGKSVGLDVAAYRGWMWDVINAGRVSSMANLPATDREYELVG